MTQGIELYRMRQIYPCSKGGEDLITDKCPKCGNLLLLQKAPPKYLRPHLWYCQKCQTMIFRPESFEDKSAAEKKNSRRPKILFIDDDEDVLEILKQQFYYAGYETIQATNAEDGLKIMLEGCPDGVVLDIYLPGMDGWTLAKTIRKTEQLAHLPVVLGTGFYTGAEAKAKALEFGIDAFVVKPYDNDVLLNILNDMVERYFGLTPTPPELSTDEAKAAESNPPAEADRKNPFSAVKEPEST